jgi:pilus assembly protein FimV
MVRVRKLVLAITAASALTSGMAQALGLGEVTLKSALNQPLVAEIELLEVRDLDSNELLPTLASPDAFSKVGVNRQYFLTDLKFTPVLNPNGRSFVRVTSSKPVREPYLNFLVQVLWPSGRLLREYTLLLDPPLYSSQGTLATAALRSQAPNAARAAAAGTPFRQVATAARARDGKTYRTTSLDTLWNIAEQASGGGTTHQSMLAILDLNPNAFIDGNINLLKSGEVLRLPDAQQINSRTHGEALAQIAEQNSAWREGRRAAAEPRQLDATQRPPADAAPSQVERQDTLKLVSAETAPAPASDEQGAAADKGADSQAPNGQLTVIKESLDATRRENDELKERMSDIQNQLNKLQQLVGLKDGQLATLQAELTAQGQPSNAENPAALPVTPPPLVEADVAVTTQSAPAAVDAVAAHTSAVIPAAEPVLVEPVDAVPAAAPAPVRAADMPAAPAAEQAQPRDLFEELMGNTVLLSIVGGGALLLLLVALMLLARRNALKEIELQSSMAAGEDDDIEFDSEITSGSYLAPYAIPAAAAVVQPSEVRVAAVPSDTLGQADIYIAYGRFNQAAEILHSAINDQPQRSDLRLKLMEVYAELADRDGFARQTRDLTEIGGVQDSIQALQAKYPGMLSGAVAGLAGAAAADELESFSFDEPTLDEPSAQAAADTADDFELNLDELDFDLDDDLSTAVLPNSDQEDATRAVAIDLSKAATETDSNALDFELDMDLALDDEQQPDTLNDDLADFDFGLDLDLDLDRDLDNQTDSADLSQDDFLLNFDAPAAATPNSEVAENSADLPAVTDDFELPADFDFDSALNDDDEVLSTGNSFAAQFDVPTAELDLPAASRDLPVEQEELAAMSQTDGLDDDEDDDEFDFLAGTDESATKLDLARAYIDMDDTEGARDILGEVLSEGTAGQKNEARELLVGLA